jgi:hypothetical protein
MSLAEGELLAGRFRVSGPLLGQGESGQVWPALDEKSGREVAIKLLHAHLAEDEATLEGLRAEAGAAGRLRHENIIEVFGLWSDQGRAFMVSRYFDGVPVSAIQTPMAPEAVVELGLQVAQALLAAHRVGRVHGDVRPGTVLVGPDGARIFDFGIAAWVSSAPEGLRPALRPAVTAPEILSGGPAGVPADLYGLGVVLYRALSGSLPWEGPTSWAVMGAQRTSRPRALTGPPGLVSLIERLLDPDPTRRPCDSEAVVGVLARLRQNPAAVVRPVRRWLAPIRLGRAWIVYGTDPATGGPAVVRDGMGRRTAKRLCDRLHDEGWTVEMAKEALDGRDLLWIACVGGVAALVVPGIGFFLGGGLTFGWRSSRVRPHIREALPKLSASLPARRITGGTEHSVSAGLLLLALGALLWWWPPMAVVPLGLLVSLVWVSLRSPDLDPGQRALDGRVATLFSEIGAAIEGHAHEGDDGLLLQGELLDLERSWHSGRLQAEEVLLIARSLRERASTAARIDEASVQETLDRLRGL